jgi:hypothetical protein
MNPDSHFVQIQTNSSNLLRAKEQKLSLEARNSALRRLAALAILIVGAAIPAWLAVVPVRPPQTRNIHIEAYRYGFKPSRIHANRGDRLRLTFSTRDARVSFFRIMIFTSRSLPATSWCRFSGCHAPMIRPG